MSDWEKMFEVPVPLAVNDGVSVEQRLSAYNEAKANILLVPEIAKHVDVR
jgi:hypothetical protein